MGQDKRNHAFPKATRRLTVGRLRQGVAGATRIREVLAVRFDDKLATVLAQPLDDAAARDAAWRQIIDILAQTRGDDADRFSDEAFDLLRRLRAQIPLMVRAEAALAIADRPLPVAVVALMAEEPPAVCAPLLRSTQLDAAQWIALLPRLTPTARALLRHRRDLSPEVEAALASFGPSDFALPHGEGAVLSDRTIEESLTEGETQIRDLLARIADFRRNGTPPPEPIESVPAAAAEPEEEFHFETGPDGVFAWVEGVPRAPLIGETIAMAGGHDRGVDGHAAGAFRQRAPFRDARLSVAGDGPVAGEWRISAVPFFDPRDGRFTGYRGTGRRPRAGESATHAPAEGGLYGSGFAPDSLRQLVHELRTPLNAIIGFAEMIEAQMLGPVSLPYRTRATDIVMQGRRLLAAVDDLDIAARAESRRPITGQGSVDGAALLTRLHGEYERGALERGVRLDFRIAQSLPPIEVDPVSVERMMARLLSATIGLAQRGETISAVLDRADGQLRLTVARPRLLAGRDERGLLDPGYSPEGDWPEAPALGLGFALRLIRNLASGAGGSLDLSGEAFVLRLPAETGQALSGNG